LFGLFHRSTSFTYITTNTIGWCQLLQMYLFGWCLFSRVSENNNFNLIGFFFLNSWRIVATIAKLTQIELSKTTLIKLIHHLKSVPLLFSNMMEALYRINLYCKISFSIIFPLLYFLYFLVTIFPPHTTVEVDLSIQRCFLLLTQFHTSILTGEIS